MSKTTLFKHPKGMPKPFLTSLPITYLALTNFRQTLTLTVAGKQNYLDIDSHAPFNITPLFNKTNKQKPNKMAPTILIKGNANQEDSHQLSKIEQDQMNNRLHSNRKWLGLVFATWFIVAIAFLVSVIYTS